MVDSVSGIYLGFDEALTDDDEKDNVAQRFSDNKKKLDHVTKPSLEPDLIPASMRRLALFRSKQSSKYKVTGEAKSEENICFRIIEMFGEKQICVSKISKLCSFIFSK